MNVEEMKKRFQEEREQEEKSMAILGYVCLATMITLLLYVVFAPLV